ncbi:helix-turn-helix transcriptional regulator [Anaerolineae bacterium CFX9]|nr:helix-turn-helix transcriptional regulator [Anaerolineae bacterium CFX9]
MGTDHKKRLAERIRRARREAEITQGELASRLGLSQGVISNVETGVSTIDAPDLPQWAAALGKPIMYFYLDDDLSLHERAAAILSMFPQERLSFVLQMLENLALTMREQNDTQRSPS